MVIFQMDGERRGKAKKLKKKGKTDTQTSKPKK
jgi:hypothetical protein